MNRLVKLREFNQKGNDLAKLTASTLQLQRPH